MSMRRDALQSRVIKSAAKLVLRAYPSPPARALLHLAGRCATVGPLRSRLHPIEGKRIRVEFTDLNKTLCAGIENGRIRWAGPDAPAHATIRGTFDDLWAILEGTSDADGLFFSRRIAIEGDGAAAMAAKNVMEGLAGL